MGYGVSGTAAPDHCTAGERIAAAVSGKTAMQPQQIIAQDAGTVYCSRGITTLNRAHKGACGECGMRYPGPGVCCPAWHDVEGGITTAPVLQHQTVQQCSWGCM